jgi:DNA-binding response OmpR family regulator
MMAAQLIREQENGYQHVPIVALTAHDDTALKVHALAVGMDDYLVKPLSLQLAQNILATYCYRKKVNSFSQNL